MKRALILLVLLMLIFVSTTSAQNNKYKQAFLYNFLKYTNWPVNYLPERYEIGILGTVAFHKDIKNIIEKKGLLDRPVIVKKIRSAYAIPECHILFISRAESKYIKIILKQIKNKPILIITEKPGLEKQGADINFITKNNEFAYYLNKNSIEKKRMKINDRLVKYSLTSPTANAQ